MAVFKCKMCGGSLEITEGLTVCECEYCGTQQTLPKAHDDAAASLFNRANNLRYKSEFDKAQALYEKLVTNYPDDSESYWGLVLCKYGIEYVEDPATLKKIPTCHRTQLEPVQTDTDYLAAIEHADTLQRSVYEREAVEIDRLQKDILEIVHNEKPFDVFICYKETDADGKRTQDSVIANDIYYQLTQEGFKVFYAAITLEDKIGQAYEPYIYAALHSANVMLVLGTKPEYFDAVWVRNEWSRYLKIVRQDRSKLLIPCYRDMDAYELPEEFAHLQAQDMSKIGFINDVIRGIKKVIAPENISTKIIGISKPVNSEIEPLLQRIELFLEDGEFERADEFCEKVLNIEPTNAEAYIFKLLIEYKCRTKDQLKKYKTSITKSKNYAKILRFGDDKQKEYLNEVNHSIRESLKEYLNEVNHSIRESLEVLTDNKDIIDNAIDTESINLERLSDDDFVDITCPICGEELSFTSWQLQEKNLQCPMCYGKIVYKGNFDFSMNLPVEEKQYEQNDKHINSDQLTDEEKYQKAILLFNNGHYKASADIFRLISKYKDSNYYLNEEGLDFYIKGVGDTVTFGDNQWIIIEASSVGYTLLSQETICNKPFDKKGRSSIWPNSTLRSWLNENFYNKFEYYERNMIILNKCKNTDNIEYETKDENATEDYVYLLSIDEAQALDEDTLSCDYSWWLRSPGTDEKSAVCVDSNGEIDYWGYTSNVSLGVRPVLKIKFD
ncbi:Tetratricopeptide repeat-containing protein [Ruminococcus flavefaciens]|uniref:Tetratricopeptide repeat-containing protein n=1 Tax=Ruminococcus flavefaciens TaxID=1265 RepID=A0A1H6LKI0_RUMFL|nr:DUF6273 domain-containing protein [Ruminococcus flavefaciens]SEH86800.1 Tetratricopeptide repeat-containing protein [Ruminococcus flavefaciens]